MSLTPISTAADALFSVFGNQQAQMGALAQTALASGADRALKGDYEGAAREFKRAIGLDSSPENSARSYDLLATSYIQLGRIEDAIKAYKSSIRMAPSDDNAHVKLGNIYFGQDRYSEAESEYKAAYRLNPTQSTNLFSLGQAYLTTGRHQEAENSFKQVIRMSPGHHGGYHALGQAYSKQGRYDEAISAFQKVISLKNTFYDVHVDLGYAYTDLGELDRAQEELKILEDKAPTLGALLSSYIHKHEKPKILAAYNASGFVASRGPGTPVSELASSLSTPGVSHLFNMLFIFTKDMDASSVHTLSNWSISKTSSAAPGGGYNWGLPVPSSDIQIPPLPVSVVYRPDALTATVSFLIQQNATGNGTLDPSHIKFQFYGKDAYGNAMDTSADEYSGISKIV